MRHRRRGGGRLATDLTAVPTSPVRHRPSVRPGPSHGDEDAALFGAAGYRLTKPVRRPRLDGFTGTVDAILEADADPDVPRRQRHTVHRIIWRLRDERGFSGGYAIVKDYVRARRQSTREAFVPLHHPPGHAQVDFGAPVGRRSAA